MNDADVYMEQEEGATSYLYDIKPIEESLLPPIYYTRRSKDFMISPVKKSGSSAASAAAAANAALGANSSKMIKVENILMTRPLFDKPSTVTPGNVDTFTASEGSIGTINREPGGIRRLDDVDCTYK